MVSNVRKKLIKTALTKLKFRAILNLMLQTTFKRKFTKSLPPIFIQIEPTTKCNLKCLTCSRATYEKERIGNMKFEDFKSLLDSLPTVLFIKLQGMGEPYLNLHLMEMAKYAKKKGIVTEVITNGTVFNDNLIRETLKFVDFLTFSIDGATKKTYESIRIGSNFELVKNNICKVVKKRDELKSNTFITMLMVVSKKNSNELESYVRLAKDIGVDRVSFAPVEQWVIEKQDKKMRQQIFNLMTKEDKKIKEAAKVAEKLNLQIGYSESLKPNFAIKETRIDTCLWPWISPFVSWDGFITPCCIRMDPIVFNFGNVFKKSFREVWNNDKYKEFRNNLINKKPPEVCKNCPN